MLTQLKQTFRHYASDFWDGHTWATGQGSDARVKSGGGGQVNYVHICEGSEEAGPRDILRKDLLYYLRNINWKSQKATLFFNLINIYEEK